MNALDARIDTLLDTLYNIVPHLVQSLTDSAALEAASLKQRADALNAVSRIIALLHKYRTGQPPAAANGAGSAGRQRPAAPVPSGSGAPTPAASMRQSPTAGPLPAPRASNAAESPTAPEGVPIDPDIARYAASDRAAAAKLGLNLPERFFDPSKDPARNLVPRARSSSSPSG